jgi:hypothetical protein
MWGGSTESTFFDLVDVSPNNIFYCILDVFDLSTYYDF